MRLKRHLLMFGLLLSLVLGTHYSIQADVLPSGEIAFVRETVSGAKLWIVNADGSGAREVSDVPVYSLSSYLDWSPDGSHIVFSAYEGQLVVVNLQTNVSRRFLDTGCDVNGYCVWSPQWSPDGNAILTRTNQDSAQPKIVIFRPDGTTEREITLPATLMKFANSPADYPQWSPDGNRIAFMGEVDERPELVLGIVNADGTQPTRLDVGELWTLAPSWSPDGTHLVFFGVDSTGSYDLYTFEIATAKLTKLVNGVSAGSEVPLWSPDGRWIAYVGQNVSGVEDIYVVEVETGKINQLSDGPMLNLSPSWSPDSKFVVFSSQLQQNPPKTALMIAAVDGSTTHQLTDGTPTDTSPIWSPQ
jgi:TolB protein